MGKQLRRAGRRSDGLQPGPLLGQHRALVAYLRRKYELNVVDSLFPAGTQLVQAEDFDGDWDITLHWESNPMCLGHRHAVCRSQRNGNAIKRTVLIAKPGNYSVWVRAMCIGRENGLITSVAGKLIGADASQRPLCSTLAACRHDRFTPRRGGNRRQRRRVQPQGMRCGPSQPRPLLPWTGSKSSAPWRSGCARSPAQAGWPLSSTMAGESRAISCLAGGATVRGSLPKAQPARPCGCLWLDGSTAEAVSASDALLEFHNGDRMCGTITGCVPAASEAGKSVPAQLLVRPSPACAGVAEKPVAVETDWLRRIVFDAAGSLRRCPPRSLVCHDGRVIAFPRCGSTARA